MPRKRAKGSPPRLSADERRALVIESALRDFAAHGYSGATGEGISYRADITHPYLLRLFGSKKELFLAVVDRNFDELMAAVRRVGDEAAPSDTLAEIEHALASALPRDLLLGVLQFLAACGDDEIRLVVRRRFSELYQAVERTTGADTAEVNALFGRVLLAAAGEALQLGDLSGRDGWARRFLEPTGPSQAG